jgi:hypothetical protein
LPTKKNECQGTDYIGPRPQVYNKSKDKEQQKATFLLNDPLIRSLDRKTTRKHTGHHYLIIYTKNTGNGSLEVLWWVLTTHTHSGKLLDHDPKNEESSQKRKNNWTSCYLNAQQKLAWPVNRKTEQRRGRVCTKNCS